MSFFLNEEQEIEVNQFLDRENRKVCEKQIQEEEIPSEFKELIQKTLDSQSPLPFFDPQVGYYSISFTPIESGNRIYIHHHLSGVSESIYDPSRVEIIDETEREELKEEELEITETEIFQPDGQQVDVSMENMKNEYAFNMPQVGEDGTYNPSRD
jgi:hypothetical protein